MVGKDYYSIGAYSMLFAAGAVAWEYWLGWKSALLIPIIMLLNLPVIPYSIPVFPVEQMQNYMVKMRDRYGLEAPLRWEDGVVRDLTQDYSDMYGLEKIPEKVGRRWISPRPVEGIGTGTAGGSGVLMRQ